MSSKKRKANNKKSVEELVRLVGKELKDLRIRDSLRKLQPLWEHREPKRWDDFTEDEQKAMAKEQAEAERAFIREQRFSQVKRFLQSIIEAKSDDTNSKLFTIAEEILEFVVQYESNPSSVSSYEWNRFETILLTRCEALLKAERDRQLKEEPAETGGKVEESKIMRTSKENWEAIRSEYDISKKDFGKKINFVKDSFKRSIIFRDVEHAFVLASEGFSKPALILAGGVIEELLRQYLEHKNIKPKNKRFVDYIQVCEDKGLLKRGVSRLSDSIRDFRNLVHLENEETKRHTVSKATAKGAVSSIFTIANDFQ